MGNDTTTDNVDPPSTAELLDALLAIVQELQIRNQEGTTEKQKKKEFQEGARVKCKNRRSEYYGMVGTLIGKTPCFWEVRFDGTSGGSKFVRRLKQDSLELLPVPSPLLVDPHS